MTKICVAIIISSFLFSCSQKQHNDNHESIHFVKSDFSLNGHFDFQFIALESTDNSLIGTIDNIKIVDNRIFILDIAKSKSVFVFSLDGKFLAKVGTQGSGPKEFTAPHAFDIDLKKQQIIVYDINLRQLFYYDLHSYQLLFTRKMSFQSLRFKLLSDGKYGFFSFIGYPEVDLPDKYLLRTDTLLKTLDGFYEAPFTNGYISTISFNNIYTIKNRDFVYHHLFPTIYKITPAGLLPHFTISLDSFQFPSVDFLTDITGNNNNYLGKLSKSDKVNSYGVFETDEMIIVQFTQNRQVYYAVYDKQIKKSNIFTISEFIRSMGLGVAVNIKSTNDQHFIGYISHNFAGKPTIHNNDLDGILKKVMPDDNPIICILKKKN